MTGNFYSNVYVSRTSSVQLPHSVVPDALWHHGLQHASQHTLPITNSWSLLRLMCIELVMPSSHLILWCPLLFPSSIFPSIGVFSNVSSSHQVAKVLELQLQHQSFQWLFRTDLGLIGLISLQSKGLSRVFCNTTVQKHQFFGAQLSLKSNSHIHT